MDVTRITLRSLLPVVVLGLLIFSVMYVKYTSVDSQFSLNENAEEVVNTIPSNPIDTDSVNKLTAGESQAFVPQSSLNTYDPLSLEVPLPFLPNYKNPCFKNEESKLYCLPYFFFLTSQKSGTTELFYTLTSHPMIIQNEKKEFHWWDRGRFPLQIRQPTNLTFSEYMDWYRGTTRQIEHSFERDSEHEENEEYHPKILGDFTANYLYDQLQWKRYPQNKGLQQPKVISAHTIHHVLPNAKFVVILRDPSERTYSDYCYYHHNRKLEEFHTGISDAIAWFNLCLANGNRSCIYDVPEYIPTTTGWHPDLNWDPIVRMRASLYSEFLADWFKVFDRKQFYIFRFEDFIKDQFYYLNEISEFLGLHKVSDFTEPGIKRQTHFKEDFPKKTKKILDKFYKPFNIKLAKMLNDERYLWNDT